MGRGTPSEKAQGEVAGSQGEVTQLSPRQARGTSFQVNSQQFCTTKLCLPDWDDALMPSEPF